MAKKKKIELEDDLDAELNFDDEIETGISCMRDKIVPLTWAVAAMAVVLIVYAFINHKGSPGETIKSFGKPEEALNSFRHTGTGQAAAAISPGVGKTYLCPGCGWRGAQLAVGRSGTAICPQCGWSPSANTAAPAAATNPQSQPCPYCNGTLNSRGICNVPGCPLYTSNNAAPAAANNNGVAKGVLIREVGMEAANTNRGVLVAAAYKGSWAQKGGMKNGDIITKFNHKQLRTVSQLKDIIAKANPEKTVPVKVRRNGVIKKLDVMIGEGELEGVTLPTQTGAPVAGTWNCPTPGAAAAAVNPPANTGTSNWVGGAGRMGGSGMGPGGYIKCPECGLTMIHNTSVPAYSVRCPNDGVSMVRAGAAK